MPKRISTALTAVSVSLLVCLSACSSTPDDPEPSPTTAPSTPRPSPTTPSPTSTPTPTKAPEVQAAEAAVLDAYSGYWDGLIASFADPSLPQDPALADNADDTALAEAQATLLHLRNDGIYIPGSPLLDPEVVELTLGDDPFARIVDCVDAANWQPLYVSTNDSAAAPGQPTRVRYEATAFMPRDRWLIRTVTIDRSQPC